MAAPITLRDVARAAGVSVATASQALRNDRNSSRSTCERVQRIARELGYRPNPALAQLASKKFRQTEASAGTPVVYVTHNRRHASHQKWRYSEELGERAQERGYAFRHVPVESLEMLRQEARRWYHQGVRGVIFGPFEHDDWIEEIDWSAFSIVCLGGRFPRVVFNTVKADVSLGIRRALATLESSAQGRLGIILHRHDQELGDDLLREGGARYWLERLAPERRVPILVEQFDAPYSDQLRRLRAWLDAYQPEGISGFALAYHLLNDAGYLAHPGRRFVAFIHDLHDHGREITGCLEPTRREAHRAMDLLDGMIRHGETGKPQDPVQILVPPLWRDGSTNRVT